MMLGLVVVNPNPLLLIIVFSAADLWRRWRERGEQATTTASPSRSAQSASCTWASLPCSHSRCRVRRARLLMADGVEVPRRIFRRSEEPLAADVSLIASEFLAGFQLIQQIDRPAVSIFGSARIAEGSTTYEQARATGRAFAEAGFAVVTEAGRA